MSKHQYSFYRPHARVQEDGGIVNHVTGEVSYPPSMTKQEFVAECDINNIIKAYTQTGQINHISAKAAQGTFEDLPDPIDLQESLAIVQHAEAAFMALPAKVRDRFHNEPGEFLEFMGDPRNEQEARDLGLLNPLPPAPPSPTPPPEPPKD